MTSLHQQLKESVLEHWRKKSTDEIIASLKLGERESLKAKADGTMMNGHHRITILRERGVDVERLPRAPRLFHNTHYRSTLHLQTLSPCASAPLARSPQPRKMRLLLKRPQEENWSQGA